MADPVFIDPLRRPTLADIESLIGRAAASRWQRMVTTLSTQYPGAALDMKHYGRTIGWSIFVGDGKRRLLYLIPRKGGFHAALALGEKAVARAKAAGLQPGTSAILDAARKYVEGRDVRIDVTSKEAVGEVLALVRAKTAS